MFMLQSLALLANALLLTWNLHFIILIMLYGLNGETAENKLQILQGHRDTTLSEKGIRQARLLAQRLKNEHFTHIFTSDLQRAKETCKIIVESNAASTTQINEDKRLRERKLGSLEGKPLQAWRKSNGKHEQTTGMESKQQHLCRQMRTAYDESCSSNTAVQELPVPKTKHKVQPVSRIRSNVKGNSKKRKHIGSGSSLSEGEGMSPVTADEQSNVVFFGTPEALSAEKWRLSSSSSSSSSGCSSTNTVCEFEGPDDESSVASAADNANVVVVTDETTELPLLCSLNSINFWSCPNVTLPIAPGRGLARVSSVSSGRGGSFEESSLDSSPQSVFASVLVVSHGGLIAELIGHFAEELGCNLPGGLSTAQQITPNAGLSRFSVMLLPPVDEDELGDPEAWIQSRIECLSLHDKDHLANDVDAAPLPTKDAF